VSIIRSPRPESNFYILDKRISEDERLSWSARGMLIFLLGKPDHWKVNIEALINCTGQSCRPAGKTAVYAIITELLDAGYLTRQRHASGLLDYYVHEIPQTPVDKGGEPDSGNPNQGNPDLGNQPLVSTDKAVRTQKAVRTESAASPLVLPEWLDPDLWAEWVKHRKEKKCPMTNSSAEKLIAKLATFKEQGQSPKAVIDHSIAGGYQGLFAPRSDTVVGSVKRPSSLNDMDYSADLF
jgi:hypothetical protein